ncbi:MAG: minor capsid protein [Clostridium sp.]|uniref:minor capsid protein n=1 Tax=Clostridia TaxID=186801 RepID=UPI003F2C90B0
MDNFNFSKDIKGFNKLSKEQKLFVAKFIEFARELYKQGDKVVKELLNTQNINEEYLLNVIAKIMLRYNIKDNVINIDKKTRNQLVKDIDKNIVGFIKEEYDNENTNITKKLNDIGKSKYLSSQYLLSLGMDFTINKISKKDLGRILNKKIKGENYSDRIWANKNEVAKKLKVDIRKFLDGEINTNQIERQIKQRFGVNKNCTKRLVRNEICRVQNDVNEQFFNDNSGEHLLYSATLDSNTCSKCANDDGKVYSVNDSRPSLPRHVNDRCTYILLPDKNYRPSARLDNETKENIDYKSYEEWLKNKNL